MNRNLLLIVIIAAVAIRIPLLFRPAPVFNARPYIEDSYYAFSVARSLGHGDGLTIDGERKTNGFQPLLVFLYAPAFALFDDDTALRVGFALLILIEVLTAFALMQLSRTMTKDPVRASTAGLAAVFLALFGYTTTIYTLNGLETGLAAMLDIWLAVAFYRISIGSGKERILPWFYLGLLGGLAVLARVDAALLVAVIAALHLVWKPARPLPFRKRFVQSVVFGASAVLLSSPWWIYNYTQFGSFVPISGLSQSMAIPILPNLEAVSKLIANKYFVIGFLPYHWTPATPYLLVHLGAAILAGIVAVVPQLRRRAQALYRALKTHWVAGPMLPLVLFIAALIGYYTLNFGAPHFIRRYLFPLQLVWLTFVGMVLTEIYFRIRQSSRRTARGAVVAFALVVLTVYAFPYVWFYSDAKAGTNNFKAISDYVHERIPRDARVGMPQSGTSGFFNDNVVNLDGKVNPDVLMARHQGRLCAYLDSARFDYLIDWVEFFELIDSCEVYRQYEKIDSVGLFLVYKRLPNIENP